MEQFIDQNGCIVRLAFTKDIVEQKADHVWAVCRYQDQWLLTKHRERGLEFPGGKIEKDEPAEVAVKREIYEETGAYVQSLHPIGHYEIDCGERVIFKRIYFVMISHLDEKVHYYETDGPVLVSQFPNKIENDPQYSFIMKDQVLPSVLSEMKRKGYI